jgi:hypothetical protein
MQVWNGAASELMYSTGVPNSLCTATAILESIYASSENHARLIGSCLRGRMYRVEASKSRWS